MQSPPWVQRRLAERRRCGKEVGATAAAKACRSNAARSRAKKSCAGFSALVGCLFSTQDIGQPAKPMAGAKCVFCDVDKMVAACDSIGGRKSITRSLKAFRADYERHSHVYNAALMRVPEALKEKRTQPRQPRNAAVDQQEKRVGSSSGQDPQGGGFAVGISCMLFIVRVCVSIRCFSFWLLAGPHT